MSAARDTKAEIAHILKKLDPNEAVSDLFDKIMPGGGTASTRLPDIPFQIVQVAIRLLVPGPVRDLLADEKFRNLLVEAIDSAAAEYPVLNKITQAERQEIIRAILQVAIDRLLLGQSQNK